MEREWSAGAFAPTHVRLGGLVEPREPETQREPRFQPSLRLAPLAAALLVAALLAVTAAGSSRVRSTSAADPAAAAAARVVSAWAPAVGALAALLVLVAASVWVRRRWLGRDRGRNLAPEWWGARFTVGAAAAIVIALIIPLLFTSLGRPKADGGGGAPTCGEPWAPNRPCIKGVGPGEGGAQGTSSRPQPHYSHGSPVSPAVVAGSTLAILALVAAIYAVQRRRRRGQDVPIVAPTLATPAPPPLDLFEDIRSERDPRRAVIAAYARMEQTLAGRGCARADAEAPEEYLARCRGCLSAGTAQVERLTTLYELAKFSTHRTSTAMKNQAIQALVSLRDGDEPAGATLA